ncbi:hypothetical protein SEA_ALONE_14 [Streptomyces phage Alone3]|nr:hypothetical protein SEA_ALONE_14 [Streptomyces phage Alone3]
MAFTDLAKHLVIIDNGALASYDSYADAETHAQTVLSGPGEAVKAWIVPVTEITEVA